MGDSLKFISRTQLTMGLAQVRLEKHSSIHFISLQLLLVLRADSATNAAPDSQALALWAIFLDIKIFQECILTLLRYLDTL